MINQNALRFSDVTWNISGLFTHDNALLFYFDLMKECGIPVNVSVHGCIPCLLNSGRIIRSVSDEYKRDCLEAYAKRGIPVFLTFSNYMATTEELKDNLSNQILDLAAAYPDCGVISGSQLISDYVKSRYPDLIISTSILRTVQENGRGNAGYYTELAKNNDRVVLHPDDGFNPDVIRQITPIEKVEILVNENCIRNCPFRKEHCDVVCKYYKNRRDSSCMKELEAFKAGKCQSVQDVGSLRRFLNGEIRTCNMSISELNAAYDLGCRNFKIQGRSLSVASLLYDVTRFMLREDCSSTVFKMMMDRIGSFAYAQDEQVLSSDFKNWERI